MRWSAAYTRRRSTATAKPALAGELGQHLPAERLDPLALVPAHVVQVDPVDAEVQVALDVGPVGVEVGGDEHPAIKVLRPDQLGHLLEVKRRLDVLFSELHAAVRPLPDGVLER